HRANLNWVNNVTISLRFRRHINGIYLLAQSDVKMNFGVLEGKRGAFGQRTLAYSNYRIDTPIPASIFFGQQLVTLADAAQQSEALWKTARPQQHSQAEAKTYVNIDSLHRNKSFRRSLRLGYLVAQSFINAGPVEFGPLEYSYSFNDLEGSRIRLSGRTTSQFSE